MTHTISEDNRCLVCNEELEFHGTTMPGSGEINSNGNLAGHADGPEQATCFECGAEYQEDELICTKWIDSVPDLEKMREEYAAWKGKEVAKSVQDTFKQIFE